MHVRHFMRHRRRSTHGIQLSAGRHRHGIRNCLRGGQKPARRLESGRRQEVDLLSRVEEVPNTAKCDSLPENSIDHEGNLLAGDSSTRDVYRFDADGKPQPLTDGWIGIPMAMAVAPDGTIYTADLELHRIWKMPAEGAKKPEEFAVINHRAA